MGEGRGVYRVLVVGPMVRDHWEDLGVGGDNIEMDLREIGVEGTNWIQLARIGSNGGL
jgi:hypothetical protein